MNTGLCLSQIKFGHIRDEVCRGLGGKKHSDRTEGQSLRQMPALMLS
jgi:hypothetical protein